MFSLSSEHQKMKYKFIEGHKLLMLITANIPKQSSLAYAPQGPETPCPHLHFNTYSTAMDSYVSVFPHLENIPINRQ